MKRSWKCTVCMCVCMQWYACESIHGFIFTVRMCVCVCVSMASMYTYTCAYVCKCL